MQRVALIWVFLLACGSDDSQTDAGESGTDAGHVAPEVDAGARDASSGEDAGCLPRETECASTLDEDCDGAADCDDADCISDPSCRGDCTPMGPESSEAACTNELDDDCDGALDCADEECDIGACSGRFQSLDCVLQPRDSEVVDLEVELTAYGFRTIMADWSDNRSDRGTLELRGPPRVGTGDLVAEINQQLRTCEHCVLGRTSTTWFPRWGRMELDEVPLEVGDTLRGRLYYWLEEVEIGWEGFEPSEAGECVAGYLPFRGVAVSGGVVASGTRPTTTADVGGTLMPLDLGICGDDICRLSTEADTCIDCGCVPDATRVLCPDGRTCPRGSSCLTHGRCACVSPPDVFVDPLGGFRALPPRSTWYGIDCASHLACGPGSCTGRDWSCIIDS